MAYEIKNDMPADEWEARQQAMQNDTEFLQEASITEFVDGINQGCFIMIDRFTNITWLTPQSGWSLEVFMHRIELGDRASRCEF